MAKRKIGVLADTHIGYAGNASLHNEFSELRTEKEIEGLNVRTVDTNNAFSQAMDIFIKEEVDMVCHTGDGLNYWGYKYPSISTYYMQQVNRLSESGIRYYEIAGNHNFAKKKGVGCELEKLDLLPNVKTWYNGYYDKFEVPDSNIVIHGLPSSFFDLYHDQFDRIQKDEGKFNVLLTHAGVTSIDHYAKSEGSIVLHLDQLINLNMELTLLGDFHKFVDFGHHIYYPGATERFSIAEAEEKPRVLIYEIDDETNEITLEHHFLDVRPMLDLPAIDAEGKELIQIHKEITETLSSHPIEDAIVRLRVINLPKSLKHRHLFLNEDIIELQEKCLIFKFDFKNKVELAEAIRTVVDTESRNILDKFKSFADRLPDNPNVSKEDTIRYGEKYLKEAIENGLN